MACATSSAVAPEGEESKTLDAEMSPRGGVACEDGVADVRAAAGSAAGVPVPVPYPSCWRDEGEEEVRGGEESKARA